MITLCTVTFTSLLSQYEATLIESVLACCTKIDEIIIIDNDKSQNFYKEWKEGKITLRRFGPQGHRSGAQQHAFGLHDAIKLASNDLVYLCDPDIFFITAADELFYNLMQKYNLDVIGISHQSATEMSYRFFPCATNMLLNKSNQPDSNWLSDELRTAAEGGPGKWLYAEPGTIPPGQHHWLERYKHLFPATEGTYDVGSALWIWATIQNWKWLSFQTIDCHLYTTKYQRGNVKLTEKLPMQRLLYHACSGTRTAALGKNDTSWRDLSRQMRDE